MWAIIKIDKKKLELLKQDFLKMLGKEVVIYNPKLLLQKYKKNKLLNKEFNLMGDYFFCFHKDLIKNDTVNKLKYSRGLKYFLTGCVESQKEITSFIEKCKKSENKDGYLTQSFFQLRLNKHYQFTSGPFVEKIFKIINLQKNKIDIYMGNLKTTIQKKEFLFKPV